MVDVHCTISFVDGTQLKLVWPRPEEPDARLAGMLERILTNESIAVEVEGRLMIIPVNNIKTMEVSPAPEKLPAMVIRDARMVL
jgi:hypothetical protein